MVADGQMTALIERLALSPVADADAAKLSGAGPPRQSRIRK